MVKDKESRHDVLLQELAGELKSLRTALRETAEGFILCKEGEIETLLDHLLKMPPRRLKTIARPWMREARELNLKPAKGRTKDLKKIDNLLHCLLNFIIEADDGEQKPKRKRKISHSGENKKGMVSQELQQR